MAIHTQVVPPELQITGAASAAAATVTSNDIANDESTAMMVVVNVTTLTGTSPTLTFEVDTFDTASGTYVKLAAYAVINAAGRSVYVIAPWLPLVGAPVSGVASSDITMCSFGIISRAVRIKVTGGGTVTNATFTVGVHFFQTPGH